MLADDRQSVNLGNLCDGHGLGSANLDGGFAAEPQKAWDIRENDAVGGAGPSRRAIYGGFDTMKSKAALGRADPQSPIENVVRVAMP
jgi:hypothetical protein